MVEYCPNAAQAQGLLLTTLRPPPHWNARVGPGAYAGWSPTSDVRGSFAKHLVAARHSGAALRLVENPVSTAFRPAASTVFQSIENWTLLVCRGAVIPALCRKALC